MTERARQGIGHVWSTEMDDRLRGFFDKGLSAGQIAKEMIGVTRNAVIGRLHRLKMKRGVTNKQAASAGGIGKRNRHLRRSSREIFEQGLKAAKPVFKIKRAPEDIKPPTIVAEPPPPPKALNVPFMQLQKGQCRFPSGERSPYLFCGLPQVSEKPYCRVHCERCFRPAERREVRDTERLARLVR